MDALALETKLAAVAASAPGALYPFRLAPDGVQSCPYASPSIRSIFGMAPEELVGDDPKIFAVMVEEDKARVGAAIERSAQTLEPFHEEFRVVHPVKGRIWATASSIPVRELDGGVLWHGIVYDVSDRVLATRALAASESRFRCYVEHAPDPVCVLDRDGALEDFNPAALRMTGYAADALRGRPLAELVAPAVRPKLSEDLTRLAMGEVVDAEYPLDTLAGESIAVAMRAAPLADGSILAFVRDVTAQRRDVTGRRRVEAALSASDERFRQLAESIREVFWLTDVASEQVIYVRPAYEAVWGRSVRQLLESPGEWLESIHADDRARVVSAAFGPRAREGYDLEYRIVRPDGEVRWIRDQAFPGHDGGPDVSRLSGVAEDVTERRAA